MLDFIKLDLSRIEAHRYADLFEIAHSNEQLHIIFTNNHQNLEIKSFPVPSQVIECFKTLGEVNNRKTVTLPTFAATPTPVSLLPSEIDMVLVNELKAGYSDTIKAIGYHPKREILQVTFATDATYQFYQVPYGGFLNFLTSDSLGSFFNQFIKNRFESIRVD